MKIGTRSLLFGVHQFAWHPITVWIAWLKLYGVRPTWRETVCIIIHDWGYWGCASMDGPDGEQHPHFGALIAGWLFGSDYHSLVLRHSRFLALKDNAEPSRLCWADKVSMLYDPTWFYLFRARLSGEIREYRLLGVKRNNIPLAFTDRYWFESVRDSMRILSYRKAQEYRPNRLEDLMDLADAVPFGVDKDNELCFNHYSGEPVRALSGALGTCGYPYLSKAVLHGIYWTREIANAPFPEDLWHRHMDRLELSARQSDWSWNRAEFAAFEKPPVNRITPNLAAKRNNTDHHATD